MNSDDKKSSKTSSDQVEKQIQKVIRLGKVHRQNINRLRAGK